MPTHVDLLIERLKQFDEVTLLELLDITAEELLERFLDKVDERKQQLFGEIEILNIEDEELDDEDDFDGFQIEVYDDEEDKD
jgi:hypothetical protein